MKEKLKKIGKKLLIVLIIFVILFVALIVSYQVRYNFKAKINDYTESDFKGLQPGSLDLPGGR